MKSLLFPFILILSILTIGCQPEHTEHVANLTLERVITIPLSKTTKLTSFFNPVELDQELYLANLSKDSIGDMVSFYHIGDSSANWYCYLNEDITTSQKKYNQTFLVHEGLIYIHHLNSNLISIFSTAGEFIRTINLHNGSGMIFPQPRFPMVLQDTQLSAFIFYEGNPKEPGYFQEATFEVHYNLNTDSLIKSTQKYPQIKGMDLGWEYWKVSKAKLTKGETAYSFPYNDTLFIVNGSSTLERIMMGNNLRLNNFQAELPDDFEIQFDFIAKTGVYGSTHFINPNLIAQVFFPPQEVKHVNGELKMFPDKDFKVLLIDRKIGKIGEALFKGSEFTHVGVFTHEGNLYVPHFSWKDPESDDFYQLHKYNVLYED